MVNPRQDGTAESYVSPKRITAGQKLFAPIGVAYTRSSIKKTLCLNIYCIVVKDLEDDKNEGLIHIEKMYITERSLWRIANWAISMRYESEFDSTDINDIERIISNGQIFIGNVKVEDDGNRISTSIDSFVQPVKFLDPDGTILLDDEMSKIISDGDGIFPKMIESAKRKNIVFVDPKAEVETKALEKEVSNYNNTEYGSSFEELPF